MMSAGRFDRVVHLLAPVSGLDSHGNALGGWQLLAKRRASIKPARRSERFENEGKEAVAESSVWLRWDSKSRIMTALHAVLIDGRLFDLVATPVEIGRREGVELLVVASDPAVMIDPATLDPVP